MKLTLNEIKKHNPCGQLDYHNYGYNTGLNLITKLGLNLDSEFTLINILNSNGIKDAIWCLRIFKYKKYCLYLADITKLVLPIFESKYPDDCRPRLVIKGIHDYHAGKINLYELLALSAAADNSSGYGAAAAAAAGNAAINDNDAGYAACYAANYGADKWGKIEQLFIKHFGSEL